jgi:hypothetical protein
MSEKTPRFAFVMFLLQAGLIFLAWLVPAKQQRGRFSKSPLEVRVPTLLARGAHAFATGFLRTLHESTIRSTILYPWEAINLLDCVEQYETEDVANARHWL